MANVFCLFFLSVFLSHSIRKRFIEVEQYCIEIMMPSTGLIIEKMFNAWTDWLLSKKSIFLSLALVETLCLSDDRSILLQFFVHFEIDTPWVHTIWSFYINDPKIFSFHHKCRPRQTVFLCVAQRKSSNFISNDNFFINSLITEFSLENFNEKKDVCRQLIHIVMVPLS